MFIQSGSSGMGSSSYGTPNGLGNLFVGYNVAPKMQTGSHNIVSSQDIEDPMVLCWALVYSGSIDHFSVEWWSNVDRLGTILNIIDHHRIGNECNCHNDPTI